MQLNDKEEAARLKKLKSIYKKRIDSLIASQLGQRKCGISAVTRRARSTCKKLVSAERCDKSTNGKLQVRAPFAGRLGHREVSIGALIRPGDTITTLDDVQVIKVDFNLSEANLPSVVEGQLVEATSVAYPGEMFRGKISSVDSRVDPITRAIQVRADIDNPEFKLRPGMLLTVNVQKRLLNTLVLPEKRYSDRR